MARATYVVRDGRLLDKRDAPPLVTVFGRAPGIIRDGMDPIPHPCTGVLMDSKAAFRAVTRAHGCIEMGNESPRIAPRPEREYRDELKRDIHAAMQMTEHQPAATVEAVLGSDVTVAGDGWV